MGIWETETLILRLVAVLFVFALLHVCGRRKETGRETVLYLTVVTASATVNLLRAGGGGFLMAFIGATAAFAVSAPLVAWDRAALRDIAAPVAAGALLGPLGGLAAIALAAAIYILQGSPGRQPAMIDRLFPRFAGSGAGPGQFGNSFLTLIEHRRLRIAPQEDQNEIAAESGGNTKAVIPACIEILHWKTSLAVATLAVLMTDMFV